MKKNKANSLYVHIPFCESICDYCDFSKLQYFHSFADKYLVALEKELHERVDNEELKTIYVGGGTPTSLDDSQFESLLKMLSKNSKHIEEYTVEANPESLSLSKIKLLKKYGVNRLSIGVESTDDKILKSINRKHTFMDVKKAVELARENGIDNINLDLIIGLPNVSEKMLEKDIINILSLNPDHISCYSLTIHEHTVFYINGIEEPIEEYAYDAYKHINEILEEHGYVHYEISNWAKSGKESKHNLVYWNNDRYYGIGLSASGYIDNLRYKNTTNFNKYISFKNEIEQEIVTTKDEIEYEIMLKLRTRFGLDLSKFKAKYDIDLYSLKIKTINDYIESGHLVIKDNHLIPTFEGMMIQDKIVLDLLP
jgi:oxygen-independent coproporphyrinogen-3 oxidase